MRIAALGLLAGTILLAGCDRSPSATAPGTKSPGRFTGIGIYDAGRLWSQMTSPAEAADKAVAKIADDEHVIVVLDSHTGEIRQCGDHSGYCVTMNPWAGTATATQLPVKLRNHASDMEAEAANAAEPDPSANSVGEER